MTLPPLTSYVSDVKDGERLSARGGAGCQRPSDMSKNDPVIWEIVGYSQKRFRLGSPPMPASPHWKENQPPAQRRAGTRAVAITVLSDREGKESMVKIRTKVFLSLLLIVTAA